MPVVIHHITYTLHFFCLSLLGTLELPFQVDPIMASELLCFHQGNKYKKITTLGQAGRRSS